MSQYHFDPETYDEVIREVPRYEELQDEVARATAGLDVSRALELGVGTGATAARVLGLHPHARLVGIDSSGEMLKAARRALGAERVEALAEQRIEDALPGGPFELVYSCLAVHHLDAAGKRELFRRVAEVLARGGRLVLGDLVIPELPEDVVTPATPGFDLPDSAADLRQWLDEAGLPARVTWAWKDLAVLAAGA